MLGCGALYIQANWLFFTLSAINLLSRNDTIGSFPMKLCVRVLRLFRCMESTKTCIFEQKKKTKKQKKFKSTHSGKETGYDK